jgi:hypothetical protein
MFTYVCPVCVFLNPEAGRNHVLYFVCDYVSRFSDSSGLIGFREIYDKA